jgi:glycosyltransferase involved in cell wall biosynthesis
MGRLNAILLVDGREFAHPKRTGISRVLGGILLGLLENFPTLKIRVAAPAGAKIPDPLRAFEEFTVEEISSHPVKSEIQISRKLCNRCDVFLSPYPKLPVGGGNCRFAHIVHDVLYLTHVKKLNVRYAVDYFRLKSALRKAHLTWYDSFYSLSETSRVAGCSGRNPRVRYPGLAAELLSDGADPGAVLQKFGLPDGYVLALGNGRTHKNLEVIIEIADAVRRPVLFVGVDDEHRRRLQRNPKAFRCLWVGSVADGELRAILKGAFCLVQPSLIEGFGYPPLEAMAAGVPAIVSDLPVLVETTGSNAMRASPSDPAAWRRAVEALEEPAVYRDQVEKGRRWAARFCGRSSWDPYARDIEDLIRRNDTSSLCSGPPS